MRKFAEALYFAVLTAWVGGQWIVGYLVAPTLFASLDDRQLAGMVAGKLFFAMGWIGFACGAYLLIYLLSGRSGGRSPLLLIASMLAISAASQFGIQPLMAELKSEAWPRDIMETSLRDEFRLWHGVSSTLYLVQSGFGLWLVVVSSRLRK